MTTYPTIEAAFKNGSGDTFFQKEGGFVAVSRKDESTHDALESQGFEFLPWHLAFEIGKAQIEKAEAVEIIEEKSEPATNTRTIRFMNICTTDSQNYHNGYYDEFPDAYGQCL